MLLESSPSSARSEGGAPLISLGRRPSAYRTSFAIDELDAFYEDGSTRPMLFKDLSPHALMETASATRPAFLYDPAREVRVYDRLLPLHALGTAACFAAVADDEHGRYWLVLERVQGLELYQWEDANAWIAAARWLGRMHASFAGTRGLGDLARSSRLVVHDGDYYALWMRRAQAAVTAGAAPDAGRSERRAWEHLNLRYDRVIERLTALPSTILHGEYYPSNILVQELESGLRVCPVDWETAALGPGLVDLAAFVSGAWSESDRSDLVKAYVSGLAPASPSNASAVPDSELDSARLHVAIQWMGWSPGWSPPPQHAHDWFREALALSERMAL